MKKLLLCFLMMFLLTETSWAQLSGAPFSSSTGTYTEITGGTVLGNTSTNDQVFVDPAVPLGVATNLTGIQGPGFPIGFSFNFDGAVYDRFAINTNGWISLGQSALGNSAVWIVATTGPLAQTSANIIPPELVARISGLGCNLAGQTGSELRIETVGTAPNRECVIQWKGYRVSGQTGDNLNFQVRLIETTNEVKIIYGTMAKNATAVSTMIGMRDKPATFNYNYTNRILNPNWANTAPGTAVNSFCQLSSTNFPASGLTFTYGPVPTCSGTPNPGNTISTSTLLCPGVNFTLSLQNFTPGYDVTYLWQYSTTGGDPWSNVTTPASPHFAQITLTENVTTYYRCQVTCSGNTGTSNPVLVTINTWLYCGYCTPAYNPAYAFDNITLVKIYPLSQSTGLNIGPGYREYFYTQNAIPNLVRGQVFNITMSFNSDENQYFGIWIDFNQSASYETTEFFTNGANIGAMGTITYPVSVPAGATLGKTRIRIRGGDNNVPLASQPCGTFPYTGSAQDYFVNIVDPSTLNGHVYDDDGVPIAGAVVTCVDRGTATTGADGYYSFQIPSGAMQIICAKTGYNEVVLNTTIPEASTVTQDFSLTDPDMEIAPGTIFLALPPTGSGDASFQITNDGSGPLDWDARINYNLNRPSDAVYCSGSAFLCLAAAMHISRVVLNTIDNISACQVYSNFTAISTNLVPGNSYTISLTEGGVPTPTDKAGAWIDWDQDGNWDEPPIIFTGTPPNLSGTFTVPKEVRPGSTRLRIRLTYGPEPIPCGYISVGEVEDYTVNINSWLTLDNNFGSVAAGATSTIPVHINAAKADEGSPGIPGQTYVSELIIGSVPETGTFTIPVTLAIPDPSLPAAEDLMFNIVNWNGGKLRLYWNYFQGRNGVLDHFAIIRNGEIIGTTKNRAFEDILPGPGDYCYQVHAVYDQGAYSEGSNEVCIPFPFPPRIPLAGWAVALGALLILSYAFFLFRRKS